jgi:hypothetical protein
MTIKLFGWTMKVYILRGQTTPLFDWQGPRGYKTMYFGPLMFSFERQYVASTVITSLTGDVTASVTNDKV